MNNEIDCVSMLSTLSIILLLAGSGTHNNMPVSPRPHFLGVST